MLLGKVALTLILRFLALTVLVGRLLFLSHPVTTDQWWVLCTALATYLATYAGDYLAFLKLDSPPNPHDVALFDSIQQLMPPDKLMPYFGYLLCVQTPFLYKDIEGLHKYVDNWRFGNKEFVDKSMECSRKDLFSKASTAIKNINSYTTLRTKYGPDKFARIDDQTAESKPRRLYDEFQIVHRSTDLFLRSYETFIRLGKRRLATPRSAAQETGRTSSLGLSP